MRFDTNLLPQGPRRRCSTRWREKIAAAGRDPDAHRVGIIRSFLVTDDPERDWPPLRAAERYRMKVYGGFVEEAGLGGAGHVQRATSGSPSGSSSATSPHCVDELTAFISRYGLTDVVTWGSAPGLQPAALTPSIERFAAEVVPQVTADLTAAAG